MEETSGSGSDWREWDIKHNATTYPQGGDRRGSRLEEPKGLQPHSMTRLRP